VTSLPGSPVDGEEVYYAADAANGVIWHLRYRSGASGSYKWEYVGGGSLWAFDDSQRALTNQTTFADLPTDPMSVVIPLAGVYIVNLGCQLVVTAGTNRYGVLSTAITNGSDVVQTEATDAKGISLLNVSGTIAANNTHSIENEFTVTTAGWKLRERAKTGGNYQVDWLRRRMTIRPVRVA
jgi:hypothetical protein